MAIWPNSRPSNELPAPPTSQPAAYSGVDIEAWTEEAVQAFSSVTISATPVRGTSVTLDIPLDEHHEHQHESSQAISAGEAVRAGYVRRREPLRRDSLKRREALLKGKEGSRRRQRWENDRLLNNPYAQPPLPSDWEVRPTHPVHSVPYVLAHLWDAKVASQSAAKTEKRKTARKPKLSKDEEAAEKVAKELRDKLKRARGAKGLLQDLELEVRKFVESWEEKERKKAEEGLFDPDSDDDEVVFVGRSGQMHDMPSSPRSASEEELRRDKLVFDSLADDHGASFGRWLVHSIGTYYGLETWSITTGKPARREAYVGIKNTKLKSGSGVALRKPIPQPLWCIV